MTDQSILDILRESNALMEGHFLLASGLHSGQYVEKFRLLENPQATTLALQALADKVRKYKPDIVVGSVTGGVILAYEMGRQLGKFGIFTEKTPDGGMELRRGFNVSGKRVLLVEDVVTTGGSIIKTADAVKKAGGLVVAFALLVDRSSGRFNPEEPVETLVTLNIETFKPEDCPYCEKGLALVKPGSGRVKS